MGGNHKFPHKFIQIQTVLNHDEPLLPELVGKLGEIKTGNEILKFLSSYLIIVFTPHFI